jgi:predicted permease
MKGFAGGQGMSNFWRDAKYALRMLWKNPGFTCVAVLTLGLGIGANTAIFSALNGLLLHPAGIPHPERLAAIRVRYEHLNLKSIVVSAPDYAFVRDNKQLFASAAMQTEGDFNYTQGDRPLRLRGAKVSWQWFDVFEAKPLLGRVFVPEEDQPKADHEVVLAYNTWKTLFGGDPGIVGQSIPLNREPYKVIGVMGPEFLWPNPTDLWAPLALPQDAFAIDNIFNENFFVVARLQPAVKLPSATAYLNVLTQQVWDDPRAKGYPKDSGWGMFAVPFAEFVYGDLRTPLLILMGAVGFVLLIACANVAGLLLARASGRSKEFAVRTALGASPWRLASQTLTESAVLSVAGMALGLAMAIAVLQALVALAPETLMTGVAISIDGRVLGFTAVLAAVAALIFGAAPAVRMSRSDPQRSLQQGRGTGGGSRGDHRFRDVLVTAELALALVLLAGAGVFLKSLSKLHDVDLGFRPHGLMTAAVALPDKTYDTPTKQIAFMREAVSGLKNSPGVVSAAAGMPMPFSGFAGGASFAIEGRVAAPGDPGPHGDIRQVSAGYFETMGIRLIRGRTLTDADREGSEPVAMIDENLARQYWPNQEAIGQHLRDGSKQPWRTIVGVVVPVRHSQVAGDESSSEGVQGAAKGVVYLPLYQATYSTPAAFLIARTNGDAGALGAAIGDAVHGVDPGQPVSDLKTMEQRVDLSLGPRRSAVTLLTVFAMMALSLAGVGLFGLVRYNVVQRTQEIGVRMALGASRRDVMRMVLGEGLRLAVAGVGGGLVAAFALTRLLAGLLYGVSASDPVTFLAVAVLLTVVALFASWLPARRATQVDPLVALRYE